MKFYLKLDGINIMGHDYSSHDDYSTEVEAETLVNNNGEYIYKYENEALVSLTEQEIAAQPLRQLSLLTIIREERNQKLRDSDWTQGTDSPLSSEDKSTWATYRQELRDLPNQQDFDPDNFTWPTEPS